MVDRINPVYMRIAASEPMRTDDVRRRSGGFRYWLLVPFSGILIYGALLWTLFKALVRPSTFSRMFSRT